MGTLSRKKLGLIILGILLLLALIIVAIVASSSSSDDSAGDITSNNTVGVEVAEEATSEDTAEAIKECQKTCDELSGDAIETCKSYCEVLIEEMANAVVCDEDTYDFKTLYRKEKVTVIEDPCEVIWLLAKVEDEYTLKTKAGTKIFVTVWRNWDDNVTAGTSFTIRGLDTEDHELSTKSKREDSGILITRYVESDKDLTAAKKEVKKAIEKLDY